MQTTYVQKDNLAQRNADKSAEAVLDASSQSESLQRKADIANNAAQRAEAPRPNNTGLPDNLKAGIESLSGFSMDDVRVHYNSSKPATVQALAYTQGTDIHVAPGQEKHLPHEAWHVAQQMAGRVSPTTNINGMPVNDNAALEHEADVMGERAVIQNTKRDSHVVQNYSISGVVQKKGDLICSANIKYKKLANPRKYKDVDRSGEVFAKGQNNPADSVTVQHDFGKMGFVALANIAQVSNPPGQCAEPHAVRNAAKLLPRGVDLHITEIFVTDAKVLAQKARTASRNKLFHIGKMSKSQGKKEIPKKKETLLDAQLLYSMTKDKVTYDRCDTCKQWVPENKVKTEYVPKQINIPKE